MKTEDWESCMLQYPLMPTICNLGIKTEEEHYAGMSDDEKAAFRETLIEIMHARNVCYTGRFSPQALPGEEERVAEKESNASKTSEHRGNVHHESHHEVPLEMFGPE